MKVSLEIDVLFDQRGHLAQLEAAVGSSLGRIERTTRAARLNMERQLEGSFSRVTGGVGELEATFGATFSSAEGAVQDFTTLMEGATSTWAGDVTEFSLGAFDSLLQSFLDPTEGGFTELEDVVIAFGRTLLGVITQAASESSLQLVPLHELILSIMQGVERLSGFAGGTDAWGTVTNLVTSLLGPGGLPSSGGTGSTVGLAVGSVVGAFTPLTPVGGGMIGGAIGGLLSGLSRGPREDDPDITVLDAASQFAFAFPQDRAASVVALTDLLDDMFQLRDYVNPTAFQAILGATGPVGNIRSTLQGLPGFEAPLATVVEQAMGPLERALEAVRLFGSQGASQSAISDVSRIVRALELVLRDLSAGLRSGELPHFALGGISPGGWILTEPSELVLNRQQQLNLLRRLDQPASSSPVRAGGGAVHYYEIKNEFHVNHLEPADFERYLRSVRFKSFMTSLGPNQRDMMDARNVRRIERSIHKVVGRVVN